MILYLNYFEGGIMKQETIWIKLLQATDVIRELHHREGKMERPPLRTTIAEAKIMHYIVFSRNGCSVKELAEQLGTTRGAVSQIIEKMVRKGPLTRVPDPDDRRSVRITLSPEGLKQHRKICVSFDHLMKKMLEGVEEEKVRIFTEVLDHLIASRDEIA